MLLLDLFQRENAKTLSWLSWNRSLSCGAAHALGAMLWKRDSALLSYPSMRVQGWGDTGCWVCLRERLETSRYVSWKQCCPKTLTEQGHVNWSLMGQRPFSIYHLMLKNASDRAPDGVQMWRGFAWTFSCSELPKQLLNSEKPRFITILHCSHLWMETAQSYR